WQAVRADAAGRPDIRELDGARPAHSAGDLPRSRAVPPERDPDQHLHAGARPQPGRVREEGLRDLSRQSLLHEHDDARPVHPHGLHEEKDSARQLASPVARKAACCTASAFTAVSASLFCSPVRMRITRSIGWTKILPSPTCPVRADDRIASMQGCTNGSEQTISTFTFSWNSMTRVVPRYWLTISCSPPWPLTRHSVMPVMSARNRAALTSATT